jgi:hypothetical protein
MDQVGGKGVFLLTGLVGETARKTLIKRYQPLNFTHRMRPLGGLEL